MLPNSRKIPTVPSATSYQTDPAPLIHQDAQHSAASPSNLAPPTSNGSKSSNFFSRFTRRRSQSTAAVTPKQQPLPSASVSTLTSKPVNSPPAFIPTHQPTSSAKPTIPSIPKIQRKPIGAEDTNGKASNPPSAPSKGAYRQSSRDSASHSKPMAKKKGSSVSLDPLRKLSQKLEKAGVSSPKATATTFPSSTSYKPSHYTPPSPALTPPPSSSSSSTSDVVHDLKKSSSMPRPLFKIAEASAETSKPNNSSRKTRHSISSAGTKPQLPVQADQPDLRALGVREKDLKAVQQSLDRLSGGGADKNSSTTSLYTTFDSVKETHALDSNPSPVYKNITDPAEPPTLADIVLQNTKSRKNARVIPEFESLGLSQTLPLRRDEVKSDSTRETAISSESFHTLNGEAKVDDNESEFNDVNDDSMLESDSDGDDSDEADNGEETFVDASGQSQEDIERERAERRLSKRLSGGHYGSAGGLLLSIAGQTTDNQHRASSNSFGSFEKAMQEFERRGSLGMLSDTALDDISESDKPGSAQRNKAMPPVPPAKDRTSPEMSREPEIVIEEPPSPQSETPDTTSLELSIDEALKQEAEEAAKKLWNEDAEFVEKEAMTEWMGQPKPLNALALSFYLNMFDFSRLRLDTAFRRLCSKLYMKAESQQIDRILEVFARRYWHCNPKSVFGSADVVYAVTYSMLLLNTDLHVVQGSHSRMTRSAFVRNTMSAAYAQGPGNDRNQGPNATKFPKWWESEMEIYLKELYYSIKQRQILQPREHQQETYRPKSFLDASGVNVLKRSMGSMVRLSSLESIIVNSDANQPSPRPSISSLQRPNSLPMRRRQSVTSLASAGSQGSNPRTPVSPYQPMMTLPGQTQAFTSQPPFYKEGIVIRKHLLETGDQKAKNRDWKECFVVVNRGELQMYSLSANGGEGNHRRSMLRASSASLVNLADSLKTGSNTFSNAAPSQHLSPNAQPLESISLNHSLSNALPPPGYNRQRPFVFALQLPNGGVYLFQVAVQEHVNEWVSTCNYWAARGSKEPLTGGVSNMEYGWGECLADVVLDLDAVENGDTQVGNSYLNPDQAMLYEWRPPAPPLVSSTLSETEQLNSLQRQLATLTADINAHREVKKKIEVKFPVRSTNNVKALTNWENRSRYLLHEIIKLQNYCDILEKAVAIAEKEAKEMR